MDAAGVSATRQDEEQAYFRAIFDSVSDAIFVHDAGTGALLDANETASRMYGYTREEFLALDIGALSAGKAPYCQEDALKWLVRARAESPHVFEWLARSKSGQLFWVEVNARFVRIGAHERFFVTVRSIDARKKAEEALRESEGRIRALLQHVPSVAVQGYRPNGEVTYWNTASERIYGYTAEEALGRNLVDLIIPAEMRAAAQQAIVQMAASGEPIPAAELELVRKGGTCVPVYSCHAVVCRPGSEPVLFCMDVDLTDTRRAEQARIELERRLLHGQKLESLGLLAGGIAHDFNNLLTAILGNLDLATREVSPLSTAKPYLDDAMKAVQRASDLTRQMLAYSGRGHFVVEDMSLADLVDENAHMLRAAVPKSIAIDVRQDDNLPLVRANAGQIQQVVMNLIVNASEAIGSAAGIITLTTGCRHFGAQELARSRIEEKPEAGRYAYVTVSDTGCGMDAETQLRLFDPFFSTKRVGRGLGLSAVLGIVRGHHGAILVDSRTGEGTSVHVLFPVSARPGATGAASPAPERGPEQGPACSGLVLLVDDEEDVLALCRHMAMRLGFRTVTATDGLRGLEVFRTHAAEIVCSIVDMTMPGLDGVSCVREIRRIKPDAKVLLSSGFTRTDITEQFGDADASGFLQKPYDLDALRAELSRVLKSAT